MIEHKTIEPEDTTTIVMSRDAIDALRRVVDLIAGGGGVIQLEPASEPEPAAPEPAWPTAPLVWHAGGVRVRVRGGDYDSPSDYWSAEHLNSTTDSIRDGALSFAREAVPVVMVPAAEWETWKHATRDLDYTPDCELIDAVDSLAQEVAR